MSILFAILGIALGLVVVSGVALAIFTARTARRVEAMLPPLASFTDVEGARLHYVDKGVGPPVVMIHGLAGQVRHFTHSMLDRLVGDFRLIIVDRPGAGHSMRANGTSARLSVQAESVAGLIRALELERPLLVGHSLGGALSLAIALAHPELVGGLALIAPLTQVQEAPPEVFTRLAIGSPFVRRLVAWTVATPLAIRGSKAVLEQIFAPDPVTVDFATAGGGLLGLRPTAFYETSSDLVAVNDDLRGMVRRYGSLRMPIGVLFGRDDRILDPRLHGESMTKTGADVTVELIDGGHMLPLTAPDRAAAFVRAVARRIV
jgi:pimeloyl-ACP methyl ester carboxylesterase